MTIGNRRTHKHTSITSVALAIAAALLGGLGCAEAEPHAEAEEIGQVRSGLGSTKAQETVDNWDELTKMVSDGNYLLTTNLNAAGRTWNPISFTGTFDGGDKIISNLAINATGSGSGFFKEMNNAIVRRVRFTSLTVTDTFAAGGIAGVANNSLIDRVGVQGTISAPNSFVVGGLVGMGNGTEILQSFVRGTVSGALFNTGGIIGSLSNDGQNRAKIIQSYVWADVTANAPSSNNYSKTGGIAGAIGGAYVADVYAVGKVTGRNTVGGLVGELGCDESNPFVLNHGVYRGDVIDQNKPSSSGGWAGTWGTVMPCGARFDQMIWDSSRDLSTNFGTYDPPAQKSATNSQLMSPTTVSGGVYYYQDNRFLSEVWHPGSNTQHHALQNMPGGLTIQPRCVNSSGVPYAC